MPTIVEHVTVPAPNVPYPGGTSQAEFMRCAARNLRHGYKVGGSNVTATIAKLLDDVAAALDGEEAPATALAQRESQP